MTSIRPTGTRHRVLAALALGALLATGFSASADPAKREADKRELRQDQHKQVKKVHQASKEKRQDRRQQRKQTRKESPRQERRTVQAPRQAPRVVRQAPRVVRQDRREVRQDRREARGDVRQDRRQDRRQERRSDRREVRQERRQDRRQDHRQVRRDIRQDRREDRHENRARQRYQQDYYRRVRAQQARLAAQRYNYYTSPYRQLPNSYRYSYGGRWYSTSNHGARMLQQAVNRGYQEGLRAGQADRYDQWGHDYRRSQVWVDASYGYDNYYVSRADYSYYFRQGFQRGYEDGYYSRGRYGHRVNGETIIIQAVLSAILNLQRLG